MATTRWPTPCPGRESQAHADAIARVLTTRGVVEEAALAAMEGAARAVGTASFFADSRVDRITRDLGLYLRQPAPDQARAGAGAAWLGNGSVGRGSLVVKPDWSAHRRLRHRARPVACADMVLRAPMLVIAPHPDDETLGAGLRYRRCSC